MSIANLINTLKCIWQGSDEPDVKQYRQLWKRSVFFTVVVSVVPVIILLSLHNYQYFHYKKALKEEMMQEVSQVSLSVKQSIEILFKEYSLTLNFLLASYLSDPLKNSENSELLFKALKRKIEGITAFSIKNSQGHIIAQAGSFAGDGASEENEKKWSHVTHNTLEIRDFFADNSKTPFLEMAVKHKGQGRNFYIITATIISPFDRILSHLRKPDNTDIFIINSKGVLISDSRAHGNIGGFLSFSEHLQQQKTFPYETTDPDGRPIIVNVHSAEGTSFSIIVIRHHRKNIEAWFALNKKLLILFGISMLFGFFFIMSASASLVCRIRKADIERAAVIQNVEIEHINKLASIGRLSSGVAHEINNPLAIISEQAGLMMDVMSFSEEFPEKEKFMDMIDSITRSVKRCSIITHRLLAFARHFEITIEDIDLNSVIEDIMSFVEKEAINRNITLNLSLPDEPPIIESDRGQLEQVFLNLINNAFDAVSDGGIIEISIKKYNDKAAKSTLSSNNSYAVAISDNGEGIAENHLKSIFEPFFTLKRTQGAHGTGLGLSITYGIVKKLGGRIEVTSKINKGTQFTVILPIKRLDNGGNDGNIESSTRR